VVPPGSLCLPWIIVGDSSFCGLLDEEGDVANRAEDGFRTLKVYEIHSRGLNVAVETV